MKKIVPLILTLVALNAMISCGPRRYGCGPNRRCEVNKNSIKMNYLAKTELTLIQNS